MKFGSTETVQPQGPYVVGGWCMGGIVALEMAHDLRAKGHTVELIIINSRLPSRNPAPATNAAVFWVNFALALGLPARADQFSNEQLRQTLALFEQLAPDERLPYVLNEAKQAQLVPATTSLAQFNQYLGVFKSNLEALEQYRPHAYPGHITLFQADQQLAGLETSGWEALTQEGITIYTVPGNHYTLLREPNVQEMARLLSYHLRLVEEKLTLTSRRESVRPERSTQKRRINV